MRTAGGGAVTADAGLSDWLRAQYDQVEAETRSLLDGAQWVRGELREPKRLGADHPGWGYWPDVERMASAVLADLASKRKMLDWLERLADVNVWTYDEGIAILAAPLADRDGYREEWRPS